jgi:hypothetical protein
MGAVYYMGCKKCGVYRELGKLGGLTGCTIDSRLDAIEYSDLVEKSSFRAGLIVSFTLEHGQHGDVFVFSDDAIAEMENPGTENPGRIQCYMPLREPPLWLKPEPGADVWAEEPK